MRAVPSMALGPPLARLHRRRQRRRLGSGRSTTGWGWSPCVIGQVARTRRRLVPRKSIMLEHSNEFTCLTAALEPPIGIEPMTYALRGCSRALLGDSKFALASCLQVAAGGDRWLLMAVRGHLGGTLSEGTQKHAESLQRHGPAHIDADYIVPRSGWLQRHEQSSGPFEANATAGSPMRTIPTSSGLHSNGKLDACPLASKVAYTDAAPVSIGS